MTTSKWKTLNISELETIKQKLTDKVHLYDKIFENNIQLKLTDEYECKTASRYEI
jgi:hypothetical protein